MWYNCISKFVYATFVNECRDEHTKMCFNIGKKLRLRFGRHTICGLLYAARVWRHQFSSSAPLIRQHCPLPVNIRSLVCGFPQETQDVLNYMLLFRWLGANCFWHRTALLLLILFLCTEILFRGGGRERERGRVSCTWGVQVVRYPNFFLGNGSR